MHTVVSVALVVGYVFALTYVALRARAAREYDEFSIAKRALPLPLIFGSLCATYVGPGFSMTFVGRGFDSGVLFLGLGLVYSLQNILVGLFVAPRLRALDNCHTIGEVFARRYGQQCHFFAGVISALICTFFAAVMAYAGKLILTGMFGLPGWGSVIFVVGVTALYTTSGGLRASVITDAFQFSAFAVILPLVLLLVLGFHFPGGASTLIDQARAATQEGLTQQTPLGIVGLVTLFLLGETCIPPYANRALASKTAGVSRGGFILAGLFSAVWFFVMIALGIVARDIIAPDTERDSVLLDLVKTVLSPEWQSVLLIILVSIVMSSLDSLLNAGAVAFTQDIAKPIAGLSDEAALNSGRYATIAIAAIAALCTGVVPGILGGLLICYTIWASAILPALIFGLLLARPKPLAGLLSMAVGTAVSLLIVIFLLVAYPGADGNTLYVAILPALLASLLAYLAGHLLGRERGA